MIQTHNMNRETVVALVQDMECQLAQAKRNVTYADKAAAAYERQRDELLVALSDLVENERRDNVGDPDAMATEGWRERSWENARVAIAKTKGESR